MKRTTSKDVAKLAGVSQSTVSLILNNKDNVSFSADTVKRVTDAARDLNYSIQAPLPRTDRPRTKVIGILTPTMVNPYYPLLTQAIEQQAAANGYRTYICNTHRNHETEKQYLQLLTEQNVDGIIYTFTPWYPTLVERIAQEIPLVVVGERDDSLNVDTIGLNSYKAGSLIAEHLLELGHQKIAYISTPFGNMTLTRNQRLEGIRSHLCNNKKDDCLIISSPDIDDEYERSSGIYETEIGYNLALDLLEKEPDVTAMIGVNDMTAYGIITALKQRGVKVPQDISVCGFDNIFLSSISTPGLTTVDHSLSHRGKVAIDILLEKLDAPKQTRFGIDSFSELNVYRIEYEPVLVKRASTGEVNTVKRLL